MLVKSLYYYPVKSCAGILTNHVSVDELGIINDRRFMVIDNSGVAITQRDNPKLALIRAEVTDSNILLTAPDNRKIIVPLYKNGINKKVQIWDDSVDAIDLGEDISVWLSDYLESDCRFVKINTSFPRLVDQKYAVSPNDQVAFNDGYPFLLISQGSLDDLNTRLEKPLPMDRFRPNIVVDGCEPFDEDTWNEFQIGEIKFSAVKPCERCMVTTINQKTLEKLKEPLKTLATYRNQPNGVMFGQNLIHHNKGILNVGDTVRILSKK